MGDSEEESILVREGAEVKKKDYELINGIWEMLKYSHEVNHDKAFWEKELEMASAIDRNSILAKELTAAVLNELDRRERVCQVKEK